LTVESVRSFYDRYLHRDPLGREHVTLVFFDSFLPVELLQGLHAVTRTKAVFSDMRVAGDQAAVLQEWWDPETRYVSVHDFSTATFPTKEDSAVAFVQRNRAIDYTSFEFPRFDLTLPQIELLLARVMAADFAEEGRRASAFYRRLGNAPSYEISVRSGPDRDREMTVRGPSPWMELCGPVAEGEIRFSPGCELFYFGREVDGVLHCREGINFLPLRGGKLDLGQCRHIVALGAAIPDDPLDIVLERGRIVEMRSKRGLARAFEDAFAFSDAFRDVVEVGIGLRDSSRPLIRDWAAPSNEAIPGVHLGIGADPAAPARAATSVHLDFVVGDCSITVNGKPFYDGHRFAE
jgi:hypothetical protein